MSKNFTTLQDVGELPQDFHPTDIHWYPRGGGPTAGGGGKKGPSQSNVSGGSQDTFLVASAEGKLQLMSGKNGRVEKTVEAHRGIIFNAEFIWIRIIFMSFSLAK